jgi:hypothetical protein
MGDSNAKSRGSRSAGKISASIGLPESKPSSSAARAIRVERREQAVDNLAARLTAALSPSAPSRSPPAAAIAEVDLSGVRLSYVRAVHQVPHRSPAPIPRPLQAEQGEATVTLSALMAMLQQQNRLLQAQGEELAALKALRVAPVVVAAEPLPAVDPPAPPGLDAEE